MSNEFKIRKDFQSIEEEIYRLTEYGRVFSTIRDRYSELKNREDFDRIYNLPIEQKQCFEFLYASGGDSSFNIFNILLRINDVKYYPTLTHVIQDLEKIINWIIELEEILYKSEEEYTHLDISLYSILEMQLLHKQQLEYLYYISPIISILKNSIIFKKENNKLFPNSSFDYDKLRDDLIEISLSETKNRNAIFKESEDETNDRFRNALHYKNYNVTDQSRGGESSSGINAGERDLVIRNERGLDKSVIEAFILKSLDTTVINKHYEKLVERYDTVGNKVNFVLVYSKTKNFDELWAKYIEFDGFNNFVDTQDEYSQKDNVRVGVSEYKRMKVYHLFINFYSHGGE